MGYAQRNRLLDLRNGSGPPGVLIPPAPQMVQVDAASLAVQMALRMSPNGNAPYVAVQGAEAVFVAMPDAAKYAGVLAKALDEKYGAGIVPGEEAFRLSALMLVADFQRDFAALLAKHAPPPAVTPESDGEVDPMDVLPEAPG